MSRRQRRRQRIRKTKFQQRNILQLETAKVRECFTGKKRQKTFIGVLAAVYVQYLLNKKSLGAGEGVLYISLTATRIGCGIALLMPLAFVCAWSYVVLKLPIG